MADRRGVRSSSRRITHAPQMPPKATTQQAGRTTRPRVTRSASRDIEEPVKPTRRSARQASVESVRSENEADGRATSMAKRKAQKEAIADLTVVEEGDTQVVEEDVPETQLQPTVEIAAPRRSLGGVSAMSGTTVISSFTFVEAESLNPRFVLRRLPKLHDEVLEFLNHLAPEGSRIPDLHDRIQEMRIAGSDFVADYNDFDHQLSMRLIHYRGESHQYIHLPAVHASLFGSNRDSAATETGIDLLLYQANLVIFAKDMINTDRDDKNMVGVLRALDVSFPELFLPALILGTNTTTSVTGDSALLQETFELALALRTQLAILYLQQGSADQTFNPHAALEEVFFHPNTENSDEWGPVRGWNTFALGGDDSPLPEAFAQKVKDQVEFIQQFLLFEQESQERGVSVNLEDLSAHFPWSAVMLRLLEWVRDRNIELEAAIQNQGGVSGIVERVQAEREYPTAVAEADLPVQRTLPRKSRTSFGGDRRRSSRKFDPNAPVDEEVLTKIKALESRPSAHSLEDVSQQEPFVERAGVGLEGSHQQVSQLAGVEAEAEPVEDGLMEEPLPQDEEPRPEQEDVYDQIIEAAEGNVEEINMTAPTQHVPDSSRPTQLPESSRPTQTLELLRPTQVLESTRPPRAPESSRPTQIPSSSRPPQSTNDFVNLLKETRATDKENRAMSLFERQANAQRVEFGDGFDDSQPTPGPSTRQPATGPSRKGKEPQHPSPKKRKIVEISDDDDDDAFDTAYRSTNIERQRGKAPKRVRMDRSSSAAPTSHQPQRQADRYAGFRDIDDFSLPETEEPSESSEPELTEDAPPRSTYNDQVRLARAHTALRADRRPRRVKRPWTAAEENALVDYMADYPRMYARILAIDKEGDAIFFDKEDGELVERRTQVDLKDKARVMAKNMIKSSAGLRPGFQGVITPAMETQLRNEGWTW
ncbi:hypothetical protein BU23DRAFT_601942 [Bimuria novae-zelandiae CBS 107.79]|uniref:Myb-like domain-containing protein n=1 Tax=Bimuria novae-zelandiae CBS 107.79 TaxID=1447943 RepID=A0A6A5UVR9_9PLEO|nr:hypothetical protein BU23DRAFT_601942 [Bimuria novae-zelandiae CBS 107.79]